jgi:hypothetical protein
LVEPTIFILNKQTPKPEVNTQVPRLFGHPLCPYAERVRLAFAAKDVKYQRCYINLRDKT